MSQKKRQPTQEELQDLYSPEKFYNYGDNPAHKKYVEILQDNQMEGKQIDHRTWFLDTRKKLFFARNWDDFLHRDLKAVNFVRASWVWTGMTLSTLAALNMYKSFLPIGLRGISHWSQTSLFYSFGYIGVLSANLIMGGFIYLWWKTTKFTLDKFYKHVLLGERAWYYEYQRQQPGYGLYYFKDDPLSCEENFPDLARAEMAKYKWPTPEWEKK